MVGLAMDNLVTLVEIAPMDRRAQRGMPRDQAVPRFFESGEVELASQTTDKLLDVVPRLGISERVEEHPFLHRGEGVQILDAPFMRERS